MDIVIPKSPRRVERTVDITKQIEEIDLFKPKVTKTASRLKLDTGIDIEAEHRELRRKIEKQELTWARMQKEYPRIGRSITGLTGEARRVTYIEDPWNIFTK